MTNTIIYSTPDCPYCKMAKEYLSGKGINFTDHDVAKDKNARQEMIEKTGQMSVPVIIMDGRTFIGFDQTEFEDFLIKQ